MRAKAEAEINVSVPSTPLERDLNTNAFVFRPGSHQMTLCVTNPGSIAKCDVSPPLFAALSACPVVLNYLLVFTLGVRIDRVAVNSDIAMND